MKATNYDELLDIVQLTDTAEGTLIAVYSGSSCSWLDVVTREGVTLSMDDLTDNGMMLV